MTAPARARTRAQEHIHLPSVHVRSEDGSGYDYEEDYFLSGTGAKRRAHRITRFALVAKGHEPVVRVTMDVLCQDELVLFLAALPDMLDEGSPDVAEKMQRLGRMEFARQVKIARGEETACIECGCSESRACSGGCVWALPNVCSRCV
jgi:hypothetical protein